ncbi:hypothetical protein MRX96_026042 [Rhipicephalus microplus]
MAEWRDDTPGGTMGLDDEERLLLLDPGTASGARPRHPGYGASYGAAMTAAGATSSSATTSSANGSGGGMQTCMLHTSVLISQCLSQCAHTRALISDSSRFLHGWVQEPLSTDATYCEFCGFKMLTHRCC